MSIIPEHMLQARRKISNKYLIGQGLEVGALHYPLWIGEKANVRYVDRLSVEELRLQYPELNQYKLVNVDIIDNGEKLERITNNSVDFIIGNHLLEHCENPLATIRNHLSKLRNSGILYYAIPDKRHSFDLDRPLTSFEHLVRDDREGSEVSRIEHFHEWVVLVNKVKDDEIDASLQKLLEINYSIHFHVWNDSTFPEFLLRAQKYLNHSFEIVHVEQNDTEIIAILRKTNHGLLAKLKSYVRNSWIN
ncbi:hypothetical protein [Nostoc sp.]|uniref:hypothetical protein n=1 Tax=Nostoc sp. TaxID=1180 RepID=UPI002FF5A278